MALSPQDKELFKASLALKTQDELKSLFNKLSLEKDGCWTPHTLRQEAIEKHSILRQYIDAQKGKICFD